MEDAASQPQPTGFVLEREQPLSRSLIWKRQRSYFERSGIQAWSQGTTPHWVTNNPFIAHSYAGTVLGWLLDWRAEGTLCADPRAPVYIVELGTGSGRFGFQFIKEFVPLLRRSALRDVPFKYVMTDFAQSNVDFWCSHASLRPFVEEGILDFAIFDAAEPRPLRLVQTGTTITPDAVRNPMVIVANYAFDSIPQDFFRVKDGRLHEVLVTISSPQPEPDLSDQDLFHRLKIATTTRAVEGNCYGEPDLDAVLQGYLSADRTLDLVFPSAALRCLRWFRDLSDGRLLIISADKAFSRREDLENMPLPSLSVHSEGAFSITVNFDALGEYARLQGGLMLQSDLPFHFLNVCGFVIGTPPNGASETRQAYQAAIGEFGPGDLFGVHRSVKLSYPSMGTEEMLSFLRLVRWDASTFMDLFPTLLRKLNEECSDGLRQEIHTVVHNVWDRYYHMGEEMDLPFCLGVLLSALQFSPEALGYFQRSLDLYGDEPATFSNMAACHYELEQPEAALRYVDRALSMDPNFEPALKLRLEIEKADGPGA